MTGLATLVELRRRSPKRSSPDTVARGARASARSTSTARTAASARAEVPERPGVRALAAPSARDRRPELRRRRCTRHAHARWPAAGSTTSSAAASIATRSTRTGWCRTSRRCSTTTRSSCRSTSTAYRRDRRSRSTARSRRETLDYLLREMSASRRRLLLDAGRRHRGRGGQDVPLAVRGDPAPARARGRGHLLPLLPGRRGRQLRRARPPERKTILNVKLTRDQLARLFSPRARRDRRASSRTVAQCPPRGSQPATAAGALDDKILTSWNALAIRALVRGRRLARRRRYLDAARARRGVPRRASRHADGRLLRTWKRRRRRATPPTSTTTPSSPRPASTSSRQPAIRTTSPPPARLCADLLSALRRPRAGRLLLHRHRSRDADRPSQGRSSTARCRRATPSRSRACSASPPDGRRRCARVRLSAAFACSAPRWRSSRSAPPYLIGVRRRLPPWAGRRSSSSGTPAAADSAALVRAAHAVSCRTSRCWSPLRPQRGEAGCRSCCATRGRCRRRCRLRLPLLRLLRAGHRSRRARRPRCAPDAPASTPVAVPVFICRETPAALLVDRAQPLDARRRWCAPVAPSRTDARPVPRTRAARARRGSPASSRARDRRIDCDGPRHRRRRGHQLFGLDRAGSPSRARVRAPAVSDCRE